MYAPSQAHACSPEIFTWHPKVEQAIKPTEQFPVPDDTQAPYISEETAGCSLVPMPGCLGLGTWETVMTRSTSETSTSICMCVYVYECMHMCVPVPVYVQRPEENIFTVFP